MLLADRKKQGNISEYIIYMYQTELLVRNFEMDIHKIQIHVINNIPAGKTDKLALEKWYERIISKMRAEKLEKEGHLLEVQEIVQELSDLNLQLLSSNQDYQQVFNAARPYIRSFIQESDGLVTDPIQACLNGVFGLLLARMKGKDIPEETLTAVDEFGNVLSFLSHKYHEQA